MGQLEISEKAGFSLGMQNFLVQLGLQLGKYNRETGNRSLIEKTGERGNGI